MLHCSKISLIAWPRSGAGAWRQRWTGALVSIKETKSVCFYVVVRGERVKAFVTRDWLVSRYGPHVPVDDGMIDVYLQHAKAIDAEIVRRFASGRPAPVWLASWLPPLR
jgi:hypothetical protein